MDFLTIFNWFSKNTNATVDSNASSSDSNKTYYNSDSDSRDKLTNNPNACITKRKVRKLKVKQPAKTHKKQTFAKSHPNKDKEYALVMLTWEDKKPVVKCYDNVTDITNYKLKGQAGYIFKNHSGVVKITTNQYLNTATGKIYTETNINKQNIEWLGSYSQEYANNQISEIVGDRTTIKNLPLIDKTTKSFFDNSDSGSEGLSADYAGSASEDEAFLTANSEFETE
jgi:hypothetical protein